MIEVFFLKGIIAGALISLPIGPIGILCLRRMLSQGAAIGIASGFGGAGADVIYSTFAIAGLSFISDFLQQHSIVFRMIFSVFLALFGLRIFFTPPPKTYPTWSRGIAEAYFSTFFLTLTNPLIILSFTAIFGALGIYYEYMNPAHIASLILGVFIGSSLWWFLLGLVATTFNMKVHPKTVRLLNKLSGSIVVAFGVATIMSILIK